MRLLSLYLFRQLALAFVFSTLAVSFVVLFTQLFRLLSLVIDNSATLLIFLRLVLLSIPTFLPLVLPLGLGVAVVFVYHRLAVDSELVVMRGAGVGPMRLALPALALAGCALALGYLLTLWLSPAANRGLVQLQYKVRDGYAVFLSNPGSFNDIADGVTFYTGRRGANGTLENILLHDVRQASTPITIMAAAGQVSDANGEPQIVVFNGRRQEMDMASGRLSELSFDQYVLDLNALRSTISDRLPDPREQTVWDLLYPSARMLKLRATRERLLGELHQRLAMPLLAPAYTLIALCAILAGHFNRRGMGRRILAAAGTIIVAQGCFMSLNGLVAQHLWLAPGLYLTALLPAAAALALLNLERLRRFLPQRRPPSLTEPAAP